MKSHRLPVYNGTLKICLTPPIVLTIILAFHLLEMDICLRVSAAVIALPKNHPEEKCALF